MRHAWPWARVVHSDDKTAIASGISQLCLRLLECGHCSVCEALQALQFLHKHVIARRGGGGAGAEAKSAPIGGDYYHVIPVGDRFLES